MIDEADIWKLAGKNAKAILGIDVDTAYDEYEFAVWLKDGFIQGGGYNNSIIVIQEDMDPEDVEWEFSLIEEI